MLLFYPDMATRIPPSNEEAEKSVLGSILIEKDIISIVSQILSAADFYNDTNSIIFDAMLSLAENNKPIDILTLSSELKKRKQFTKIGAAYLTELVNAVPTSANTEYYSLLVKEAASRRSLIQSGAEITNLAFDEEKGAAEVIDKAESLIFAISQKNLIRGFRPIKDALAASFDRIDELHRSGAGLRGLRT